jgi:hypothetical protein
MKVCTYLLGALLAFGMVAIVQGPSRLQAQEEDKRRKPNINTEDPAGPPKSPGQQQAESGTIGGINLNNGTLSITRRDGASVSFTLTNDTGVGSENGDLTLGDLKPGDHVVVRYRSEGEKKIALSIALITRN